MINLEIRENDNLFILTPEAAITEENISHVTDQLNDYINTHDRAPNLVLHAATFPHWEGFAALKDHFKLVRDHHNLIGKVAIVTDSKLVGLMRPVADLFIHAKIRRFPEKALEHAIEWASHEEDDPGEFEFLDGFPENVIAIRAEGLLSSRNYQQQLGPLVEEKLKTHDKVNLLYETGESFLGYSGGAMWDDARLGFHHFTSFNKVALVTDIDWIRHGAKFFGAFFPGDLILFDADDLEAASEWIKT